LFPIGLHNRNGFEVDCFSLVRQHPSDVPNRIQLSSVRVVAVNLLLTAPEMIVTAVVVGIAVMDLSRFRIPNAVTFPFALAGIAFNAIQGGSWGLGHSLAGAAIGFVLLLVPFLAGGFGGGDVKLLTAIGAWVGAVAVLEIFVVSAVILGLVSLLVILANRNVRQDAWRKFRQAANHLVSIRSLTAGDQEMDEVLDREDCRTRAIPFGAVVAFGLVMLAMAKVAFVQSL
jgi:prepilin peptidase CpaA